MSNYSYKNTPLTNLCKGYSINTFITKFNTGLTYVTSTYTNVVNERPIKLDYKYDGTDISTYCIANYIESSTTNFTNTQIPSWCTKIRAVLVGGGGGGHPGTAANYISTTNPAINQNENINQFYKVDKHSRYVYSDYNHPTDIANYDRVNEYTLPVADDGGGGGTYQENEHYHNNNINISVNTTYTLDKPATAGGGGGSGGFIYLKDKTIGNNAVSITVGSGGNISSNGNDTVLKLGTSTTYTAGGGKSATNTSGGAAVSNNINNDSDTNNYVSVAGNDGSAPSTTTGGSSGTSSEKNYNTNSTNGSGGTGGYNNSNAASGKNGYYRIYFLTD